ncbi:hypothetical protein P3W43_10525 [Salinicola salarius]|uniref:hypothetical protein n=1 Tax=Salinicola salarius TaxID=430457 RepID=UPI0023E44EF4|nr:hypothetical protein [Salinicola salarius]MDF3919293.1 hypothetical protein [Salinicola salarius]
MSRDIEREPEIDQLAKFLNILNAETERGVPLTAAAMLDDVLNEILEAFFADNAESQRLLSSFNAPLGTFSSRISACYALALIGNDELQELTTIRKIRNKFAHRWESNSFDDDSVRDLCGNLPWRGPSEYEAEASARSRFSTAVSMLLVDFMWRVRLVINEKRQVKSWPNRARP